MKRIKKISAMLMAVVIVVSLLAAMSLTASAKTVDVNDAAMLRTALSKDSTEVINITGSFTYNNAISLTGNKINLNLNGHTLNVTVAEGTGILLRKDSRLSVNGPGTLNVTAESTGIAAKDSVFSADGSVSINVTANSTNAIAVNAEDRGYVSFTGNAAATGSHYSVGVYACYIAQVNITGNISATGNNITYGVYTGWQGETNISGSVSASGANSAGAYAVSDGTINISGNATATSAGSIGAFAESKGKVFVTGVISGDGCAIKIGGTNFSTAYPTRGNVSLSAPRNGHTWAEFRRGEAYVYMGQQNITTATSGGGQWRYTNGSWYYYNSNGNRVQNTWVQDGGKWYYLKYNGKMASSEWLGIDGEHYYFRKGGELATGWVKNGGNWILFRPDGTRASSGWLQDGGAWYYLNSKGEATTGGHWIDGVHYYFFPNGMMATGWVYVNNSWYYYRPSGAMVYSETTVIDGKSYTFDEFGRCVNP